MTTSATSPEPAAATSSDTPDAAAPPADEARRIVKRNVYWAIGAGLVPIPVADFVAMTAVQVKMLKELADHYQQPFLDEKAKKIVGSLVAGTGSLAVSGLLAHSFFKIIPILGQAIGIIGVPVIAGALTQAIGNTFIMHYESGGTLLDFDPDKMREHFQQEFSAAQSSVKRTYEDGGAAKSPRVP